MSQSAGGAGNSLPVAEAPGGVCKVLLPNFSCLYLERNCIKGAGQK